jgi:hypothetical protein
MSQNVMSRHLAVDQWALIDDAIKNLIDVLEPALIALTADQRQRIVKMGDGSEAFCRKALDVISENVELMPRNFDVEEMRRDLTSHDALHTRIVRLTRLLEKAHDTDMALGSDVMVAALEGYSFLKTSGKAEGVDALRKLLGKRFESSGRKPDAPVQTPDLATA